MKYCPNEKCQKTKNDLAFVCGMLVEQNELLEDNNIPTECEWIVEISRRYQNA